jgi:hypothetical protein
MSFRYITLVLLAIFLVHCSNPKSSGKQRQDVSIYDVWVSFFLDNDGDGYFSKVQLTFDVDVSAGDISIDAYIGYRLTGMSGSYTAYGYIEGITITGDSEADTAVFTIGAPFGELSFGRYDFLLQIFPNNDTEAAALAEVSSATPGYSFLGNVGFEPAAEDVPFEISFTNPVFTPIDITLIGIGSTIIEPGYTYTFNLPGNPGSFSYYAETSAQDASGNQLGLKITWNYTHDVSAQASASYTLVVLPNNFFIYIRNEGTVNQNPIYVNYGNSTYETQVDVTIPPDRQTYRLGYFNAFEGTEIRAYTEGTSQYFWWIVSSTIIGPGYFSLPWTNNQYVTLFSNPGSTSPAGNYVAETGAPAPLSLKPKMAIRAESTNIQLTDITETQLDYGKTDIK